MPPVDDPTIKNDERLLRRIHPEQIVRDDKSGGYRVSSAAFNDVQLSTDLYSVLIAAGLDATSCVRAHDGYGLVAITAGLAREKNQVVYREPVEGNEAHGIVEGKKPSSVKKAFVAQCEWIIDTRPTPPAED